MIVIGQSDQIAILLDEDKLANATFHTFIKHKDSVKFIGSSGPSLPKFESIVGKQLDDLFPNRNDAHYVFWNMIYLSALNGEVGHQLVQYANLILSIQTFTLRDPEHPETVLAGMSSITPLTPSALLQLQNHGPDRQSIV